MERKVIRLLLAGLLALGSVSYCPVPLFAQSASEVLVDKARALEGRGRPDLAAQTWQQVLLSDPNHQEALATLARFAKQGGNAEETRNYLNRLRAINPSHPALQQVQATPVLVQQQARLKEAARLVANQQFDQAMQIYRQVFGDEPPPGAMAVAYYETQASVPGGWESATAGLQKLMDLYPAVEDYKLALGKLWTYRPPTRMAGMRLLESIKGGSDAINRARQAWRQALIWEGANPQVLPSARAYLAKHPDPELSKMFDGLTPAASASAQSGPVRSTAEHQGYAELKANKVKDAEVLFETALKQNPKAPGALAGLGFVRMKQENFSDAAALFESAAKEAPKDKDIADALETARFWAAMDDGSKAFAADQVNEAVEYYRKALEMRPTSPEALNALGGTLMKSGDPIAAAQAFEKLTEQQPQNEQAWYELLNARYRGVGADSAIAAARQLPGSVRLSLSRNIQFLAMMSSASSDAGKSEDSKRYLHEAIELSNVKGLALSAPLQLQFAGLYLRHGYLAEATAVFQKVVDTDPRNVDAWEGLLTSLIQTHQESRAARTIERMPARVFEAAVTRPGALRSLAAIAESMGQLEDAEKYLEKSIRLDSKINEAPNVSARLQLAHLWLAQGRDRQAETLLRDMTASQPDNPDAWKALVSALHKQNSDELALKESGRLPKSVSSILADDPDYVSLLASVHNSLGRYTEALRLVRRASALMRQQERAAPADLEIQLAWLLLNTNGEEQELYSLLTEVGARADLTQMQQDSVSELWSTWILRRANAAADAGDANRALAVLEAGTRMLPRDTAIRSSYAGILLQAGDPTRALTVYKAWGLTGAGAPDFAGAVGAALGAGDMNTATEWLRIALNRWPGNGNMLNLAGKLAAAKGDYKTAQRYWNAALAATPAPAELPTNPRAGERVLKPADDRPAAEIVGELLLGSAIPTRPAQTPASSSLRETAVPRPSAALSPQNEIRQSSYVPAASNRAPAGLPPNANGAAPASNRSTFRADNRLREDSGPFQLGPASLPRPGVAGMSDSPAQPRVPLPAIAAPRETASALPPVAAAPAFLDRPKPIDESNALRSEIQDRLDALDARNSSYFGTGGDIRSRSGEAGFDRMILQQANLEASHVVGGGVRVSVIAHPTYIESGSPDGASERRFGLLPAGASFETQASSGVGGEVQISTQTFGLRIGSTPRNFLVSNFVGGLRFRPGNGPITLLVERESLRDSMLAFSGVRDPVTNRVWGGVIANTFSAQGNWGGANSGFYTGFGFQTLHGQQVQSNSRIDGNVGMYFRVLETPQGKLTAGFNLTGMHYEKNLRYFTLGHGGYFSPQQYILANVPVQWRGMYNQKVQYMVNASLGAQHFQEQSSAFFPTLPALQGRNGPYYPKQVSTGANYSIDIQSAVPLTPVWHLGIFANMNNTRNFHSAAAGVFLRYSTRPRPLTQDFQVPSIPDWRGVEPFRLY
jgi:tetratricopeptide (TPR) repeat protein